MTGLLFQWVLSSSLLIGVVTALRLAFGRRISARLRYALWLAVLLRLLIPVQLFTAPVETPAVLPQAGVTAALPFWTPSPAEEEPAADPAEIPVQVIPVPGGEPAASVPAARRPVSLTALAGGVWLAGSAALLLTLLAANGSFAARLRRVRKPLPLDGPAPVWLAEGLPSPCLFGVLRPAVYMTPEAAADPVMRRHVLAHEFTHYRHGDHVWALLRCVALAVHWWNPLVWLAALLSRRDAELACDEGALRRLDDGERRDYGNTLLSLVTAKPQPGDLLRCATTMAGGKRSLRERIDRIARTRKRWLWAAVLTAAMALLVCACSFTKPPETLPDSPLTQEELTRFNTEIFNGAGFNIRNQLLFLASESPEDYRQIDLYQLFYNGTGGTAEYTAAERQAVADAVWDGIDPGVDLIKCPASEMDGILREHLGLSLDETEKRGLDQFVYLAEYDAYYDFHGDTNYPGEVQFFTGERKDGKIFLFYQSGSRAEGCGWPVQVNEDGSIILAEDYASVCVTLEEQKDGGYHFLSNALMDASAMPTAYPDWDPERTIPLDGLTPYLPETVAIQPFSSEAVQELNVRQAEMPYYVEFWWSNAYTYARIRPTYAGAPFTDYFLRFHYTALANEITVEPYKNVCGHDGFRVTYPESRESYLTAYYYFDEEQRLQLLVNDSGYFQEYDLDGDGQKELIWSPHGYIGEFLYLLYQRDGQLYKTEILSLIYEAWPEAGTIDGYSFGEGSARCISMSAALPVPNADFTISAYRTLCFDGERLLLYKDETPYVDHIRADIANKKEIPAAVLDSARRFVEESFRTLAAEGFGASGSGEILPGQAVWDDWRITELHGPYYETVENDRIEIWRLGYETRTSTPEKIGPILAGGSYLGEDGWGMIGYPNCDYLYFRLNEEDGQRTFLFSQMQNDCAPGTELFREDLLRELEKSGRTPSS